MPSKLSTIRAAILTHLDTTSIYKSYNSTITDATARPIAFVNIYGESVSYDFSQTLERNLKCDILVKGSSIEQVDLAIEEILVLWVKNNVKFNELVALGVTRFSVYEESPPIEKEGDNQFEGFVGFDMTVRYNYTA